MEHPTIGMEFLSIDKDYQRVRRILEEEFHAAITWRDAASAYFDEVRRAVLTGLPHPDGTQQITNASRDYAGALSALSRAALRITDFEARGIIPDNLKSQE